LRFPFFFKVLVSPFGDVGTVFDFLWLSRSIGKKKISALLPYRLLLPPIFSPIYLKAVPPFVLFVFFCRPKLL